MRGPFAEVAPPLWSEFLVRIQQFDRRHICEYLGMSGIDKARSDNDAMIYQAGVAVARKMHLPAGLQQREIKSGKYARFFLTGRYARIWMAFDGAFTILAEKKVTLRSEFCIENYLNNPSVTPEGELKTELLIPIA